MGREKIFEKVEEIWEDCQDRNIGSNEAELEFKELLSDWIMDNYIQMNKER